MDRKKRIDYTYKNDDKSAAQNKNKPYEKKQRIIYDYYAYIENKEKQEKKELQERQNIKQNTTNKKETENISTKINTNKNSSGNTNAKTNRNNYIAQNDKNINKPINNSKNDLNYTKRNNDTQKNTSAKEINQKGKKIPYKIIKNRNKNNDIKVNEAENIIDLQQARARRKRRNAMYKAAASILILVGVCVTFMLLFQVENIEIIGQTQYTNEQISAVFEPKNGDNLFLFNTQGEIDNLQSALPYIEQITIKRKMPNTIELNLTQAKEVYSVSCVSGWAVLSESMRVLNILPTQPENLTYINGVSAKEPQLGAKLTLDDDRQEIILNELLMLTQKYDVLPITHIDISDILHINFTYSNRIQIILGTSNDMQEKIEWAKYLITPTNEDALGENDNGVLDVSNRDSSGRLQAIWRAQSK